jgi:hypothetical protein
MKAILKKKKNLIKKDKLLFPSQKKKKKLKIKYLSNRLLQINKFFFFKKNT